MMDFEYFSFISYISQNKVNLKYLFSQIFI